jgi:hypothetical protein
MWVIWGVQMLYLQIYKFGVAIYKYVARFGIKVLIFNYLKFYQ